MENSRYFTTKDLKIWNTILEKHNLKIYDITNKYLNVSDHSKIINYKFNFCISNKRFFHFNRIFKKYLEQGFNNNFNTNNILNIFDKAIIEDIDFHNRKLKSFSWNITENIQDIIHTFTLVNDALDTINLLYDYDSEFNEKCISKYNIGSVLSIINDERNYMVIDIILNRQNTVNGNGEFIYKVCEINHNIKHKEIYEFNESDLVLSDYNFNMFIIN